MGVGYDHFSERCQKQTKYLHVYMYVYSEIIKLGGKENSI